MEIDHGNNCNSIHHIHNNDKLLNQSNNYIKDKQHKNTTFYMIDHHKAVLLKKTGKIILKVKKKKIYVCILFNSIYI